MFSQGGLISLSEAELSVEVEEVLDRGQWNQQWTCSAA